MCSSCALGEEGRPTSSAGSGRLNMLAAGLIIAAGAASAAFGLASLLGHSAGRTAATPRSASTLELHGRDLRTGRALASALRGRAVIVEFWSSACPGCRQVAANLQRLASADRSAALVGIDVGDTVASARTLVRSLGWRQLSTADPDARYAQTASLRSLPTTLLLDNRHRLVLQVAGVQGLATLARRFGELRRSPVGQNEERPRA